MFEVKFKGYRYNTGYGDNGIYSHKKEFETMEKSIEFVRYLIKLMAKEKNKTLYSKKDINFLEECGIDFVIEFVGLFQIEIIEREIHIRDFL